MDYENSDLNFVNDFEQDNLDLNNIQNEFKSLNLSEYNTNADLLNKIILSSQSACLKTGTSSNDCENTIKLNEDDLIDRNDLLKRIFQDFIEKNECIIDQAQGLFATKNSKLSKSIQRKLINLNQLLCQGLESTPSDLLNLVSNTVTNTETSLLINQSLINQEYKKKLFRLLRSIVERVLIDALSLYDQYINQIQQQELIASQSNSLNSTMSSTISNTNINNPTSKLWIEIRNRGCQFLGPQMQDDVLRLTLHALETVNRMSRKVLVLYVVHMLKKHYPKASKTSVGHVIQLLYRAGCFIVEKRDNDSSLMELRKEFMKYPALRRQHDMQIIQIALESGIRMSPEQWSQKLFGDSTHKSEMQSIIDKLQSQQTIEKLILDFFEKIQTGSQSTFAHQLEPHINLLFMSVKSDFDYFSTINFEKKIVPTQDKLKQTRNSMGSTESPNNIGSGGESLASEDDDFSFDANDLINFCDYSDFESNDSYLDQKQQSVPQVKIIWSLLTDCIKRTVKILSTHIDYTSKLMSIIQNKTQTQNNKISINLRSQMSNSPAQSPQPNLNINFSGLIMSNQQSYLMPMGPSVKQPIGKPKYQNKLNQITKYRSNDQTGDFMNRNQFGYSNFMNDIGLGSKIWSDDAASVSSNSSNGINKNRIDFNNRNSFNNHLNGRKFNEQNTYQNNFFDSNSIMMNPFGQDQSSQFYSKPNQINNNYSSKF